LAKAVEDEAVAAADLENMRIRRSKGSQCPSDEPVSGSEPEAVSLDAGQLLEVLGGKPVAPLILEDEHSILSCMGRERALRTGPAGRELVRTSEASPHA
jgi:hypothetical protein